MLHVDDGVVEHSIVDIIDRNFDVRAAGGLRRLVFLRVDDLARDEAGELLLQNIVHCLRQIHVDCEVDILSRLGILALFDRDHLSRVVDDDLLVALDTLQGRLQIGLDSRFSDHVINPVDILAESLLRCRRIELRHLVRGYFSGIPENMRKVFAVHILPHGVLNHGDTGKHLRVLHDDRHRPLADIRCDSRTYVFPVGGQVHGITDCHQLQPVRPGIALPCDKLTLGVLRVRILTDCKGGCGISAQIFHNVIRRRILLLLIQRVNRPLSVDIRDKSQTACPLDTVFKFIVFIENNLKIRYDMISVFFNHADQCHDGLVQVRILFSSGLENVLKLDRVGKLVVRQHIAVAVIDVSPRARNVPRFLRL